MRRRDARTFTRRTWLIGQACLLSSSLLACATQQSSSSDLIVNTANAQPVRFDELISIVRSCDFVLLGEVHDNPRHHASRARLLAALGGPVPVVAEHLPRTAAPMLVPGVSGDALRQALEAAGFDARGWEWPVHEPLFAALAKAGDPLRGGNLENEITRRVAREGPGALPPDLRALIEAAPLSASARAALEQDLESGHCGRLPSSMLPAMVWAQRGRDASMALAMGAELMGWRAMGGRGPVVLLAGNGHVRRDYGVPQLLARLVPGARMLSVGFVEENEGVPAARGVYDLVWATAAAKRKDPCAKLGPAPMAPG